MQQPRFKQHLEHGWQSANGVKVDNVVLHGNEQLTSWAQAVTSLASWRQVGQQGHAVRNHIKVLQHKRHLGLASQGQQVQDAVGGAAQRHKHGDGVLKGLRNKSGKPCQASLEV